MTSRLQEPKLFETLDTLIERIRRHAREPEFSIEVKRRQGEPDFSRSDAALLERMIELVAFSQAARSDVVNRLIQEGRFKAAFGSFEPSHVSQLDQEAIKATHWHRVKGMRQRKKLDQMVNCGRSLVQIAEKHGSFMNYLKKFEFSTRLTNDGEIDAFWHAFDRLWADFRTMKVPLFAGFTSLCHLISDCGFDCAKPDSRVIDVAVNLGIVSEKNTYSDTERRDVVRRMQEYSAARHLRTSLVDFYFLIIGRQTDAVKYVSPSFYRL